MATTMFGDPIINAPQAARTMFGDPVLGAAPPYAPPTARRAQDIADAFISGLQSNSGGLMLRRKLPDITTDSDSPMSHRLAAGVGGIVSDLPAGIVGAIGGMTAGTSVAGPPGTVIGGAAGGFAVPMSIRDALVTAYNQGEATSWQGVWEIAKSAMLGFGKGAVIGGATGGAGAVVGKVVAPMAGEAVLAGRIGASAARRTTDAAVLGSELTAMTGAAAALEGHMPTWQDFMDNAILLGGLKGAVHIAGKMRTTYAETGKRPEEVRLDAERDAALKAELTKDTDAPIGESSFELPGAYRQLATDERVNAAVDFTKPEVLVEDVRRVMNDPDVVLGRDPIAYEYVVDKVTAEGVVRHVAEVWRAENEAAKRGVVPVKQSVEEGVAKIKADEIKPHAMGEAGNAAEIAARAMLTKGAAERAQKLATELTKIPESQWSTETRLQLAAAIEQTNLFYQEFKGVGAEVGRALNMLWQIKRNPGLLGNAESLLALYERKMPMKDMAYLMSRIKDTEGMKYFASEYSKATTTEKVLEAWKAAILSGPQTQLANAMGNTMKWVLDVPESIMSATLFAASRAIKGDPIASAQWKARAFAPYYGVALGARDALTAAKEVALGKGEHLEKADVYRHAIEGTKGEIIRLPFKALQVQDALVRTMAERGYAHVLAVDRAVNEKLLPGSREFNEAVVKYAQDPTFGLTEAAANKITARIQEKGAEAVFAQELGPRMQQAQRAISGHWMQFIVPFVRTPANLVSWSVQHLPGLNLMSGRWMADWKAGGEQRAQAASRVILGTGIAVAAYSFAEEGKLTGGGMFDKEQRRAKTAAGWQPYSILIDGKWYSYQRMEPVAKVLGIAADLFELQTVSKDKGDKAKIWAMTALMFGNATISTTYLSGLSNSMNALADPDRYGGSFVEQYASSLVPKLAGQTAAAVDPYKREVDGAMDAIQSQIPFLREKLLPKRDVWGEPVKNDKWFEVLPVNVTEQSKDKVRTEAARLQLAIADAPKFVYESSPLQRKDEQVKLTEQQRDVFRGEAGKFAMQILTPMVNHPDWDSIPNFAQADIYKETLERARKWAELKALPPDDPAREKMRQEIIKKIMRQATSAEQRATPGGEKRIRLD